MSPFTTKMIAIIAALLATAAMAAPIHAEASPNDLRFAPNPGLAANLVFRVILAIFGTALCWVPFRLLWRNGDFAAVVLIIDVALMNFITVLNSLIWNSDDWDRWWIGTGLCDVEVYVWMPLQTVYAGAILAIVRQLAGQVKLTRASQLTRQEHKMRALVQAAIIFPAALIQLIFTWFDIAQRYNIGTLIGCIVSFDDSWPRFIVYDAPPTIYVLASVPYAVLTWMRFRAISKNILEALKSNEAAIARATGIRNRLYIMSMSILVVYLPVSLYLTVENFLEIGDLEPYSYTRIHWGDNSYPWDAILFIPSWLLSTVEMNQPWIAISTTIVIVGFFGTTKDGLGMYRRYAVALIGLGRIFPRRKRPHNNPGIYFQSDNHPKYARGSWIELINQPNRRRESRRKPEPIDTNRIRHIDAFYDAQNTGTTTGQSTGKTPLLSLPLPPRCDTSPGTHMPLLYSTTSSPLDGKVIETLIPPRTSSLAHLHQQSPALQGPASALPRISQAPTPQLQRHSTRGRGVSEQRRRTPSPIAKPMPCAHPHRNRMRSASETTDRVPILSKPSLSPIHRAADNINTNTHNNSNNHNYHYHRYSYSGSESPSSQHDLRHARSRDAVQLSSVLEASSFHTRPSSYGGLSFYAGGSGALTSSTASAVRARDLVASASGATSAAHSSEEGYVRVVIAGSNPLTQIQSPGQTQAQTQGRRQSRAQVSRTQSLGQGQGQSGRSPGRHYNMGALRGRGVSAPRTVDEVKAEGVKCTEYYDSDYSDA